MANYPSAQNYAQTQDVAFRDGVSTNFWRRAAATLNFLLDRSSNSTATLLCASSGSFSTISNSTVLVTNQSGSITVLANRPIIAGVIPDGTTSVIDISGGTDLWISVNSTLYGICAASLGLDVAWITLSAGTYTFQLLAAQDTAGTANAKNLRMFVRQL